MSAVEGTRNDTLNRAAFSLGQLVAAGELDRDQVERELTAAAELVGLQPGKSSEPSLPACPVVTPNPAPHPSPAPTTPPPSPGQPSNLSRTAADSLTQPNGCCRTCLHSTGTPCGPTTPPKNGSSNHWCPHGVSSPSTPRPKSARACSCSKSPSTSPTAPRSSASPPTGRGKCSTSTSKTTRAVTSAPGSRTWATDPTNSTGWSTCPSRSCPPSTHQPAAPS